RKKRSDPYSVNENYVAALGREAKWRLPQRMKRAANGVVARRRCKEHEKSAASGAQQLAALCAGVDGSLISLVDDPVGDATGHLPLRLPSHVQHFSERLNIPRTKVLESGFGQTNHLAHGIRFRAGRCHLGGLLLQQSRRRSGHPGIKEDQACLQVGNDVRRANDLLHFDRFVRMEANEVEAAIGRSVLVLLSDRLAATFYFDLATFGRELGRG